LTIARTLVGDLNERLEVYDREARIKDKELWEAERQSWMRDKETWDREREGYESVIATLRARLREGETRIAEALAECERTEARSERLYGRLVELGVASVDGFKRFGG
jgi:hypothetical protein